MGINGPESRAVTPELANFLDGVEGSPYGGSLTPDQANARSFRPDGQLSWRDHGDRLAMGDLVAGIGLAAALCVVNKVLKIRESLKS